MAEWLIISNGESNGLFDIFVIVLTSGNIRAHTIGNRIDNYVGFKI